MKPYHKEVSWPISPPACVSRRELIEKIATVLEARMRRQELTLRQAAEILAVSHPRIADLLARRAERFSLDRLALLAEQLGLNVRIRATRPYGTSD